MLKEYKKFIADNKLIDPDEKILLAISGGIDSMVMAHLFIRAGYRTGIAHCNFSLRTEESDKDEELVRQLAFRENIPFHTIQFETKSYAKSHGLSVQMAARELRYEWFEAIRVENGYDKIAVAHNLNDNIETVLINLVRGTGIAGLTGMKASNNRIIRPLLFATRENIVNYCRRYQIVYREDMSNADTKYTRNKIRHQIIPVLKEINPSIETTLNETAERFSGISEIVSDYVSDLGERISERKGNFIVFNLNLLKNYLHNRALLFELFKSFGITNVQINDLLKVICGKTGGQILTSSHRIVKNRKELIVTEARNRDHSYFIVNTADELNLAPGILSAGFRNVTGSFEIPSDPLIACVDADKISFPVIIRRWMAGDSFYPLGMKNSKKLSDYFINSKYSILEKENKLIMETNGKIVWIIGDRIDNRFRITKHTTKALLIRAEKEGPKIMPVK